MYRLLGAVLLLAGIGSFYLAASGDRSARNDPEAAAVPPMARTALPVTRDMPLAPADRTLIRDLQRELKRVGCYEGEIDGVWTRSTRDAMERFTELANAKLPTHEPDIILLSLVRSYARDRGCDGSVITTAAPLAPSPRAPPLEGDVALAGPQAEEPAPGTAPHRRNPRASEPPSYRPIDSDWIGELWKRSAY